MAGYVGSDAQVRLMRQSDDNIDWARSTPGACNVGRMLGCDDIDALGWSTILDILKRDGMFVFRLLQIDDANGVAAELKKHGYRLDLWDVFSADRASAIFRANAIMDDGLPEGLSQFDVG